MQLQLADRLPLLANASGPMQLQLVDRLPLLANASGPMQLQLADRLPLLANATCSALHCRRFSDTFDLHQPLEGLRVTMAQLLAICIPN
jgi:hypothetical protein